MLDERIAQGIPLPLNRALARLADELLPGITHVDGRLGRRGSCIHCGDNDRDPNRQNIEAKHSHLVGLPMNVKLQERWDAIGH
jgi:hypothetical protein